MILSKTLEICVNYENRLIDRDVYTRIRNRSFVEFQIILFRGD